MMDVIKSINGDYSTIMKNTSDPISDIYYNYSMMNDASNKMMVNDNEMDNDMDGLDYQDNDMYNY